MELVVGLTLFSYSWLLQFSRKPQARQGFRKGQKGHHKTPQLHKTEQVTLEFLVEMPTQYHSGNSSR
jgi:hypothetical protein